jgi:hypothetical protein
MATAVTRAAGTVSQHGREPFLAMVLSHAASHRQVGRSAEARLAFAAARSGSTWPPVSASRRPTLTSGPGMESEP